MKIILIFFPKKCSFQANGPFWTQKFCAMNEANCAWKLYQWIVQKNPCFEKMGHLGLGMSHPVSRQDVRSHNSGSTVRIVLLFCTMNVAKRWWKLY